MLNYDVGWQFNTAWNIHVAIFPIYFAFIIMPCGCGTVCRHWLEGGGGGGGGAWMLVFGQVADVLHRDFGWSYVVRYIHCVMYCILAVGPS